MDLRSASSKNYYELLGIAHDASAQEIRANYHELARVYHPDSNFYADISNEKVSPEQIELFKIITAAYQTLIDPKKRKEYDDMLAPITSNKITQWEDDSNSNFWDKQVSFAQSGPTKRVRAPTFGQTGARPFKASLREELSKAAKKEASVKETIKRQSQQKTKVILMASLGLLLGVVSVCALILTPEAKLNPNNQPTPKQSQENKPQLPNSWKNSLNG